MDDDMQTAVDHLQNHIDYPADAADIKTACNDMSDVPDQYRQDILTKLPDGTYNSADEVTKAVGWT